ncbi:MAG TPA: PfkB family carbohydrate kinase, partial [Propionibacteriaceae bacterium]
MRALVGGHLCIDFFPQMDRQPGLVEGALYSLGPMVARPGGCVYTTGQTMAGLGIDVRLAAAVGQDPLAGLLLELCRSEGLDTAGLSRIDASTSYTIVSQAPGRDRTFWHHLGANEFFDGRDLDLTGVDLV